LRLPLNQPTICVGLSSRPIGAVHSVSFCLITMCATWFFNARCYAERRLSVVPLSYSPSVRLSVCFSVSLRYPARGVKHIVEVLSSSGKPISLASLTLNHVPKFGRRHSPQQYNVGVEFASRVGLFFASQSTCKLIVQRSTHIRCRASFVSCTEAQTSIA